MSESCTIAICEIFGPTIQGEGALIGLPTIFVRTGGCDYRCRWCDTAYAVDNAFRDQWIQMSAAEIFAQVTRLSRGKPLMISLSGGNPALQPLQGLIALGKTSGYRFAMETQGSVAAHWFADLAVITLSPKPPSSGMKTEKQRLQDCVKAAGTAALSLKFVVRDETDFQFAKQVSAWFPQLPVYLQPCNEMPSGDPNQVCLDNLRRLVSWVLDDDWPEVRVLPQLHMLLWGNTQGR